MSSLSLHHMLSDLRNGRLNSALAHRMLSVIYRENRVYSVPFGPLQGMKLRYDRTVNYQILLGLAESAAFRMVIEVLGSEDTKSGYVMCDAGANIGTYSLLFARYVPQSVVYAFEPAPSTAQRLRDNLALNRIDKVSVHELACSDRVGQVEFYVGEHHTTSSLHSERASAGQKRQMLLVETTALDDFFYGPVYRPGPNLIKMDIEGGGTLALKGCDQCIREKRPLFLIESHTPDEDRAISDVLLRYDYQAFRTNNRRWVRAADQTHPHPDGVWGTMFLWPAEKRSQAEKVLGS